MKERLKEILKSTWNKKIYSGIILAIGTITIILFYIIKFITEKEIIFSEEEFILFLVFGFIIIIVSVMLIYIILLVKKLSFDNKHLHEEMENIQESLELILYDVNSNEDNICKYLRVIEELIMKLNKEK